MHFGERVRIEMFDKNGQLSGATMGLIDTHHHISAPAWRDAMVEAKIDNPLIHLWSAEKSLAAMDQSGVETSITSMPFQYDHLPGDKAARLARATNDYAKTLEAQHPDRFGTFATLPLPHIDESLREIAYLYDELKVDGVCLQTSYGTAWLGYEEFAPVFEELNRRRATVYTHPIECTGCVCRVRNVQPMFIEFGADTTRTIASLITARAALRYPNINFIFSHGGGVLTAVAERFLVQMVRMPPMAGQLTRADVQHDLNHFYYDTAQITQSVTFKALLELVPTSHILFGSDWPYRSPEETALGLATLDPSIRQAIERTNALPLLPLVATRQK